MSRKLLFAANWKMHMGTKETNEYLNEFVIHTQTINGDVVFFVPYTVLSMARELIQGFKIGLGAQNFHHEDKGAFTGEISLGMLKEFCNYVLIGHSERRHVFNETNTQVNKKLKKAFAHNLLPVVCIGETEEEKNDNKTSDVLAEQLQKAFEGIIAEDAAHVVIAYEPVWAIGSGKTPTPLEIEDIHSFIRETIEAMFGNDTAQNMRILYGGSVKPDNAKEILEKEDVDGVLVGGASLDPKSFLGIIKSVN
jgi:triosephosphate isomerase (TIM)